MFKYLKTQIWIAIKLYFSIPYLVYKFFQDHTTTFLQCKCLRCSEEYTRIQGNIKRDGKDFYCPKCKARV